MTIALTAPFTCLTMLSLLLLVGCERSHIAARRQANAADYAALTAEDKALVDRGELRQGMSTNAVLIAWGQPTIISTTPTPNGPFVIWEYYRKRAAAYAAPSFSPPVVESLDRTAVFHHERLVSWHRE